MKRLLVGVALITSCGGKSSSDPDKKPVTDEPPPKTSLVEGVDLPEVEGVGYAATSVLEPLVTANQRAISVDKKLVVALVNGRVQPVDREDGNALSIKIPSLVKALARVDQARPPLVLALDKTLAFENLVELMFSAKQKDAGWKQFSFLASHDGKLVALPITLPDQGTLAAGGVPTGRISVAPPIDASSLTPDVVLAKINAAYIGGVRRCYKALLTKDPSARGKVTLALTVNPSGRVVAPSVRGFSTEMDRCITDLMPGWVFPKPTPDEATFSITLQFVPEDTAAAPAPKTALRDDDEARRLADLLAGPESDGKRGPGDMGSMGKKPLRDNPLYVDLDDGPAEQPLKMVVSVSDKGLAVWSFSGLEGTPAKPRLKETADDAGIRKVRDLLLEIAQRRYGGKPRSEASKAAVLMADPKVPIEIIAKVMGAMRGGTGAAEAFPDIQLSAGFR